MRERRDPVQRDEPFRDGDALPSLDSFYSGFSSLSFSSSSSSSSSSSVYSSSSASPPSSPAANSTSQVGMVEYVGYVSVTLFCARDLLPMSRSMKGRGSASPLVKLTVGSQSVKSQVRKGTVDPDWGGEVLMLCWDGTAPLEIDIFSNGEHLGAAVWPLDHLLEKNEASETPNGIESIQEEDGDEDEEGGHDDDDDDDDDDGSDASHDSGFEVAASHRFSEIVSATSANDQHFDIDDEEDGGDEEDRREEEDGGEEEFHDVQQAPVTPETEGDVWIPLFARDSTKKVGGGSQLSTSVRRMMRGSVLLGKRTAKGKVNFSVSFEPIKH